MQALARFHHAGLDQFLVEFAHGGQKFRTRHHAGFRVLARLHNHHESHRLAPFVGLAGRPVAPAAHRSSIRRTALYGTDMSWGIILEVIARWPHTVSSS